ncbi:MAG: hypothetical protein ACRC33_02445 [Gemmataceae bacterium]
MSMTTDEYMTFRRNRQAFDPDKYTLAEGKSVCTKRRGGEYGELKRPTE